MSKHLYVFKHNIKHIHMYNKAISKLEQHDIPYKVEENRYMHQQVIKTRNDVFVFVRYTSLSQTRGVKTHYLYIDKAFKDTEFAMTVLLPMLNVPYEISAKERLKWI